jgi:hypothetical protein
MASYHADVHYVCIADLVIVAIDGTIWGDGVMG